MSCVVCFIGAGNATTRELLLDSIVTTCFLVHDLVLPKLMFALHHRCCPSAFGHIQHHNMAPTYILMLSDIARYIDWISGTLLGEEGRWSGEIYI